MKVELFPLMVLCSVSCPKLTICFGLLHCINVVMGVAATQSSQCSQQHPPWSPLCPDCPPTPEYTCQQIVNFKCNMHESSCQSKNQVMAIWNCCSGELCGTWASCYFNFRINGTAAVYRRVFVTCA